MVDHRGIHYRPLLAIAALIIASLGLSGSTSADNFNKLCNREETWTVGLLRRYGERPFAEWVTERRRIIMYVGPESRSATLLVRRRGSEYCIFLAGRNFKAHKGREL